MILGRIRTTKGLVTIPILMLIPLKAPALDPEIEARLHEDIAKGYCVAEVLSDADTQFSQCKSVWESPVRVCGKESGINDYMSSNELPEDKTEGQLEAARDRFTSCLFSELITASENTGDPNSPIYRALIEHHGLHSIEESDSKYFTYDQVESGSLDAYFAEQSQIMNESLPVMVDELSRLERVAFLNRVFSHYYTIVGVAPSELQSQFSPDAVEQFFTSNACNHWPSRNAMKDGIVFGYEFRTEDGAKHTEVSISIEDCAALD